MDKYLWFNIYDFLQPNFKNLFNLYSLNKSHLSLVRDTLFQEKFKKMSLYYSKFNEQNLLNITMPFTLIFKQKDIKHFASFVSQIISQKRKTNYFFSLNVISKYINSLIISKEKNLKINNLINFKTLNFVIEQLNDWDILISHIYNLSRSYNIKTISINVNNITLPNIIFIQRIIYKIKCETLMLFYCKLKSDNNKLEIENDYIKNFGFFENSYMSLSSNELLDNRQFEIYVNNIIENIDIKSSYNIKIIPLEDNSNSNIKGISSNHLLVKNLSNFKNIKSLHNYKFTNIVNNYNFLKENPKFKFNYLAKVVIYSPTFKWNLFNKETLKEVYIYGDTNIEGMVNGYHLFDSNLKLSKIQISNNNLFPNLKLSKMKDFFRTVIDFKIMNCGLINYDYLLHGFKVKSDTTTFNTKFITFRNIKIANIFFFDNTQKQKEKLSIDYKVYEDSDEYSRCFFNYDNDDCKLLDKMILNEIFFMEKIFVSKEIFLKFIKNHKNDCRELTKKMNLCLIK